MQARRAIAALLVTLVVGTAAAVAAEPIEVRFVEGVTRAFPALRNLDGKRLAHGDLTQVVRGDRVDSRLVFRFLDGSIYDESVAFSQREQFTLLSYRLAHRGPSFPETIDASIDRWTGRYEVRYRADDESPEETLRGTFDIPDDAYNGMLSLIVKNLAPHGTARTVSIVAFTPKPRAVKLELAPVAEDHALIGDLPIRAMRYRIRPQLGLLASLLVVDIPDVRMWIVPGEAPAFLRVEGPLYFMGPVWRIEPY